MDCYEEIKVKGFQKLLLEADLAYDDWTLRYFLRTYPELGKHEKINGSKSSHYIFFKEECEKFIRLKTNEHAHWYSFNTLMIELNLKKVEEKKWRNKFYYIMVNKLQIHPVKLFGRMYIEREKVAEVKQYLNPIRSNVNG